MVAHTIVASQTDSFGNSGTATLSFTLDTTAPTGAISSTIGTNTGLTTTISSGGLTKDNTLALSGTVSDTNGVSSVHVFDGAADLGAATLDGLGGWSLTTAALSDGSHSFTAKATDTAGNVTTTSAVTATVDTTAPTETISSTIGTNTGLTTTISSGGLTKDNTLALSGTVSDTNGVSSVHVFDGAADLGAATLDGLGGWILTTAALSDGSHSFTAKATDTAGDVTTTSAVTATVDTTAPAVAISSLGGPINQAAQTISGTGEAGATVTLFDNGTPLQLPTVTVGQNGLWSASVTLNNGSNSLTAQATDAAGNTSPSTSAVIYTLTAAGPTVTENLTIDTGSSAIDRITSNDALTGTGLANTVVHFTIDGSPIVATVTADAQGAWSFTPSGLADGPHTIVASQTDSFGNSGTATLSFTLDTTAPTGAISSTIGTNTGLTTTISSGGLTKDNTLALSGTVSDTNGVSSVHVFDGAADLGAATLDGLGGWSLTTAALSDGSHSFTAKATDTAGNVTTTSAVTATVDTTAPTETISSTIGTNTGLTTTISSGGLTKDNTLALSGTVSDTNGVSSVHVFDGAADLGAATLDGLGGWSLTTAALSDGSHSFTAKATDTAGDVTTTSAVTATVDTTAPAVAISSLGGPINQAAQTISGTGEAGATVTLFDNGTPLQLPTVTVGQNGLWSASVTLNNGSNSLTAQATDAAGNTSPSTSAVIYTLTAAGPTVTENLTIDTGSSAIDRITSNDALTGTGLANTVVHFTIDGSPIAATVTADAQGAWSFTPSGLADGPHTIVASQTDSFGNSGTATLSFTLDTTAPTEAISSTIGTNTGLTTTISSGGLTKDNTLALSGTVSDTNGVSSVHVFDGAADLGAATLDGLGGWSLTTAALSDGSHSFTAKATDTAGNVTTTSAVTATVDTTAPTETISSTIGTNTGLTTTISSGGLTKDNTLALSGTVSDTNGVSSVHVFDGATDLGAATLDGLGGWSLTTAALSDGSHSFTAKATDTAGDVTTTSAVTATVDTTAPTIAINTIANNNIINAAKASRGFTISGTSTGAENGQVVTVNILNSANSVVDSYTTTDRNNAWSVSVTSAQATALADGSYTVTANVADKAGNPSPQANHALTVDEEKVAEPPALAIANTSLTVLAGGSVSLGITATPVDSDDRVSVKINGVPSYERITAPSGDNVSRQLQSNGTYNWTITESASAAGTPLTGLTLSSSYTGTGHPVAQLTVTASNATSGETASSASQILTVTDPPAATAGGSSIAVTNPPAIALSAFNSPGGVSSAGLASSAYTTLAGLLDQYMAAGSPQDAPGVTPGWLPGKRGSAAKRSS